MVAYAYRHVPHYRKVMSDLGLAPAEVQTAADLSKLPLLEPSSVAAHPESFISSAIAPSRCLRLETSGSSGLRRAIYASRESLFQNAAHAERERFLLTAAIGKKFGYREAVIVYAPTVAVSSTPKIQQYLLEHAYFPSRLRMQRLYVNSLDTPASYLDRLNAFKPDLIQGYGSGLESLFLFLVDSGFPFHRPRAVFYHSDGISNRVRQIITDQFQIPVFSAYQACEALKIGFECDRHNGYHVNVDLYPVRIVGRDGCTLADGETGDVVVSNLVNRGMVLLNYRLGDSAAMRMEPCLCGRNLPRLTLHAGPSHGFIHLPSGRIVDASRSYIIFAAEPHLRDYQLEQAAPAHFRLHLVVPDPGKRKTIELRILDAFRRYFGEDVTAEMLFVDSIPLTAGGKKKSLVLLPNKQNDIEQHGSISVPEQAAGE
jgi:phenylacetate-CoA ligase